MSGAPKWKQTIKSDYGVEPGIVGQSPLSTPDGGGVNFGQQQSPDKSRPGESPLQWTATPVLHLRGSWWLVPAVSTVRRVHPRPIGEPGRNLAQNLVANCLLVFNVGWISFQGKQKGAVPDRKVCVLSGPPCELTLPTSTPSEYSLSVYPWIFRCPIIFTIMQSRVSDGKGCSRLTSDGGSTFGPPPLQVMCWRDHWWE